MKKVSVIGLFCDGRDVSDGQSVKTRIVTQELEKAIGADRVHRIDTYGWKKDPFKLFFRCIAAVQNSENVIFMTDEGGIKVFPWLLQVSNFRKKCRLHYVVIGGWLVDFLRKHAFFSRCLKSFDNIFAETSSMKSGLELLGFQNVTLMPNCKNLQPLTKEQVSSCEQMPYRFCTFSRVMREKGIEDAVDAIRYINSQHDRVVCELDIYGAVDPSEAVWFENLSHKFTDGVRYCGVVPYDQTTQVLKPYYALLFPTFYPKEGIPGTIIDAFAAGLPVIASRWSSFDDIIDDGITGIGYPYRKNELLREIISESIRSPDRIAEMKVSCLKKAEQFLPTNVMGTLIDKLA